MWFFIQLCSSWQDFNWHSGSRGPSAAIRLLLTFNGTGIKSPIDRLKWKALNVMRHISVCCGANDAARHGTTTRSVWTHLDTYMTHDDAERFQLTTDRPSLLLSIFYPLFYEIHHRRLLAVTYYNDQCPLSRSYRKKYGHTRCHRHRVANSTPKDSETPKTSRELGMGRKYPLPSRLWGPGSVLNPGRNGVL